MGKPAHDPEEMDAMECECGQKIEGRRKHLYYLYKLHQVDHPELAPVQWTEAAHRIAAARDAAKERQTRET